MNILVDIGHPGHVHFFRNALHIWNKNSHNTFVTTRDIPTAITLLNNYNIEHTVIGKKRTGAVGLGIELLEHTIKLIPLLRRWNIDTCTSIGGTYMIYAALFAGCKRIVFTDTETATYANKITFPLASALITPEVYPHDLGRKHIRYKGFHELAYLHHDHFKANPDVLTKYHLKPSDKFSIVRLCAWEASHDLNTKKATHKEHLQLINKLKEVGPVIIVPEANTHEDIKDLIVPIDPQDFHNLLSFAHCCVTEGATTASEACILGTPTLYINPIRPCYIPVMQEYGLLQMTLPGGNICNSLEKLLQLADDKPTLINNRNRLRGDYCDTTKRIVSAVAS